MATTEADADGESGVGAALGTGECELTLVSLLLTACRSCCRVHLVKNLSDTRGFSPCRRLQRVDPSNVPGPQRCGCQVLAQDGVELVSNEEWRAR